MSETKIKEIRTIEATKKGYMGIGGKFGKIAKLLGDAIVETSEGGTFYTSTEYRDWYDSLDDDNDIPYMDIDDVEEPIGYGFRESRPYEKIPHSHLVLGWNFDGLSRGMHLEIMCKRDENQIIVTYKGYEVYNELNGTLLSFVPEKEWEDKVERLFSVAKQKENSIRVQEREDKNELSKKEKVRFLEKIRLRWGI